ncbi:MAG: hypothetical protein M9938_02935 [Solirubrobacterales bacterium]|nr:hypothetical protein [Solirubrobacterales bacterium]
MGAAPRSGPGSRPGVFLRRLPLLMMAVVALIAALWAGLIRLGLDLPDLRPGFAVEHGILFVLGFLGTQIGLERAVALGRGWTYIAPATAGAGALWLILGLPPTVGEVLFVIGGVVLVAVFVVVHRIHASWHNLVMGLGAVGWLVGAAILLAGGAITSVVPWLAVFLVLTIVGERLELSRMAKPPEYAIWVLLGILTIFLVGVILNSAGLTEVGIRIAGIGLVGQALWLARYDVARRTIRIPGPTRFMAASLIIGYFWLAVAGVAWLIGGSLTGYGFSYDAMVHAIFVGFVFSMIFAHAPVIVPAVLGVPLPFRQSFYGPLVLLHIGLVIRLLGDAAGNTVAWQIGGVINEVAILAYFGLAVSSAVRAKRAMKPKPTSQPATA